MKSHPQQQSISISAVERESGLSKDNLRIWERRYGFPQPIRDAGGDRLYSYTQVDRLTKLLQQQLVRVGLREFIIVGLSFSGAYPVNLVGQGLRELHNLLRDDIAIWAGGVGATQVRWAQETVTVLRSLRAVEQAVSAWRSQHAAALAT